MGLYKTGNPTDKSSPSATVNILGRRSCVKGSWVFQRWDCENDVFANYSL